MDVYQKILALCGFWAIISVFANPWFKSKRLVALTVAILVLGSFVFLVRPY